MLKLYRLCKVVFFLGVLNAVSVLFFRLQIKFRYFFDCLPIKNFSGQKIIFSAMCVQDVSIDATRGITFKNGHYHYFFSNVPHQIKSLPDWFLNVFTNTVAEHDGSIHWSKIPHFFKENEDIKVIWELSRFYWMVDLAVAYRQSLNADFLILLQNCVKDWCIKNPVNAGVNWACGQETGLRLANFIIAIFVADIKHDNFIEFFILMHMERILPTMHYARAQCNNHIISECVSVMIAVMYLNKKNTALDKKFLMRAEKKAKSYFYSAIKKLILEDGTFSQYSMTYHRMVLDAFSLMEAFRKTYKLPFFEFVFYEKYQKLFFWLFSFTDFDTGRVPNMGGNDGTLFFKLEALDYRDFRPSLQLASVLIENKKLFDLPAADQSLKLLKLVIPTEKIAYLGKSVETFKKGGYVIFHNKEAVAYLRYPKYLFRPNQVDPFHFDFWYRGKNYLIDAGSYSYNTSTEDMDYFNGPAAHNLVMCDDSPIMRRISRFLIGDWLKADVVKPCEGVAWAGVYRDCYGHLHRREISVSDSFWKVVDEASNYQKQAVLLWHLAKSDWIFFENGCENSAIRIEIFINDEAAKIAVVKGHESLYYHAKSDAFIIKVVAPPSMAKFETVLKLK